jgi:cytochrome P450
MAPNELSYSSSSSWQDIYASNSARPNGMPRDTSFFASIEDENAVPSLVTASDKDHSRIRSNFAKAFSEQALAQQRPLIIGHVNTLMKKLHEVHHEDINIVNMFNFTIADILANLSFGEPMHLLNDETHRAWVYNQFGCVRSSRILATLTDFPIFRAIFHVTLSGFVKRARVTYFGWMNKKIDHRLTKGVDGPDTIHFVTQGEKGLTEPELRSNLPLILFAGLDTLSAALSGLVAFLVEAPETLQQLQDEVRSTFPESSAIDAPTMKNMKVLNACINEILRIYPGAPGEFPRVVPAGGAMISGKWVPAGIRVYTSPLGAFRSPANFHDPDSFHPERWYTETDDKFSADDRNACKPFSIGTSDCVGQRYVSFICS